MEHPPCDRSPVVSFLLDHREECHGPKVTIVTFGGHDMCERQEDVVRTRQRKGARRWPQRRAPCALRIPLSTDAEQARVWIQLWLLLFMGGKRGGGASCRCSRSVGSRSAVVGRLQRHLCVKTVDKSSAVRRVPWPSGSRRSVRSFACSRISSGRVQLFIVVAGGFGSASRSPARVAADVSRWQMVRSSAATDSRPRLQGGPASVALVKNAPVLIPNSPPDRPRKEAPSLELV